MTPTVSVQLPVAGIVAPDRLTELAVLLGVPGEVEIVAIGDTQYMKNAILTAGNWLEQQFSPGFNAETLIRSDNGIESAIRNGNVSTVGFIAGGVLLAGGAVLWFTAPKGNVAITPAVGPGAASLGLSTRF